MSKQQWNAMRFDTENVIGDINLVLAQQMK